LIFRRGEKHGSRPANPGLAPQISCTVFTGTPRSVSGSKKESNNPGSFGAWLSFSVSWRAFGDLSFGVYEARRRAATTPTPVLHRHGRRRLRGRDAGSRRQPRFAHISTCRANGGCRLDLKSPGSGASHCRIARFKLYSFRSGKPPRFAHLHVPDEPGLSPLTTGHRASVEAGEQGEKGRRKRRKEHHERSRGQRELTE
jgi:hypothetical protein